MGTRALVALLTLVVSASAVDGWAFWTAPGAGTVALSTGTILPATLSTPASATNAVTVTWTDQASLVPSSAANSDITYTVERKVGAGSYAAVSTGGCTGTKMYGITSCADAPDAAGSYSYRVVSSFATWTATSSASGPVAFVIDATVPTVLSIDRVGATPTNLASVSWTVTFSEAVTGVNSADFALAASGPTAASISTVTGSGTTYTVTASTGTGSGTLGLNLVDDDSISDPGANRLGGTGTGNGSLTGQAYTIDKTVPTASSIARVSATPTNLTSVSWTVTFSEVVTGVDSADFALAGSGPTGTSITTVTGSGTTYTVTASTGSGDGSLGLNLADDDTIIDTVTNQLGGTGAGNGSLPGQTYTIDKTAPAVASINRTGPSLTNATSVSWTVTFSETVTGVNSTDFALAASGLTAPSVTTVTGSGTTYTVTASTGTGTPTGTLGLNLVDDDTITDAVTNKLGGTGTGNGNRTGEVYAIDRTPPTAPTPVTVTSGGNIWPTAKCSEPAGVVSYVNAAGITSVGVSATVAAPESGETIVFTATRGATQTATVAVGTPVTLDLTSLSEGAITLTARAKDAAGNLSTPTAATGTVIKDTVAPAAPTANYADPLIGTPRVSGTSECSAAIIAVRVGRPQDVYPTTAGSTGSYSVDVSGSLLGLLAVQYSVTATDRAGNTGAAATT